MPEPRSATNLSNPVSRYPRITPPEPGQKPKLLDRLREAQCERDFDTYLTHLPFREKVSDSTQNEVLSVLLGLYTLLFMSGKRGANWVTLFGGMHFDKSFGLEPVLHRNSPGRLPGRLIKLIHRH